MRKEIFVAIILGLTVGLVVTYGVYTANQALSQKQNAVINNAANSINPTPVNDQEPALTLSVSNPEDGIVVSEPDIKVGGTTLPKAIVTIITDSDEIIVEADENGVFQEEIALVKGANTIEITATDLVSTSPTKTIQLVYSTEIDTIKTQ